MLILLPPAAGCSNPANQTQNYSHPGNLPFLFPLLLQPEYPWRPPCAMARSQNAQAVAGVKPVPKDLGKSQ